MKIHKYTMKIQLFAVCIALCNVTNFRGFNESVYAFEWQQQTPTDNIRDVEDF